MSPSPEEVKQRAAVLVGRIVAAPGDQRTALVLALRPAPEDYARVFVDEVAEPVRAAYEAVWRTPPAWRLGPDQTEVHITAATVDDLRAGVGPGRHFPGGYRQAAPFLRPGHVWIAWEVRSAGASSGMAFDGLILVDDTGDGRWGWFPKPWRALPSRPRTLSHWSD